MSSSYERIVRQDSRRTAKKRSATTSILLAIGENSVKKPKKKAIGYGASTLD
jgi:hypothetical protein